MPHGTTTDGGAYDSSGDYDLTHMRELEAVRQAAAARESTVSAVRAALDAGYTLEQIARAEKQGSDEALEREQNAALERVARCAEQATRAQKEFRSSVVEASDLGLSSRRIAAACGYSPQWIQRLVKAGRS